MNLNLFIKRGHLAAAFAVRLLQESFDVSKVACPETLTVTSEATAKARIDRSGIMIVRVLVATNSNKYETEVRMEEDEET